MSTYLPITFVGQLGLGFIMEGSSPQGMGVWFSPSPSTIVNIYSEGDDIF